MQNGNNQILTYTRLPVVGQLGAAKSLEYLPIVKWRDVRLPSWATRSDRFVVAEICGDSLESKGVKAGDFALVHLTRDISQGDLAAICTPNGMLIKFVFVEHDGRVRLESAHPDYPPICFEMGDIDIQGRVVRTERDW